MKRWAGAALVVVALSGCSSAEPAAPQPSDTQGAKDRIYLEMAREAAPGAKDENLLAIRTQTCEVFKANPSRDAYAAMIAAAVKNGTPADVAGKLTALSVTSACPEFENLVGG